MTAIDLSTAPETQLNDHMSAVIACLMRVWDKTVQDAGYTMPRPPLVIFSSPVSSACGRLTTMNAAYCGSDQKIYYATDLPKAIPNDLRSSRFVVEVIVAHEFGHAIQARTAILSAGHGLEDGASTDAARREWSRRIELQADCFAGMFIHSVAKWMTQQDLDNIADLRSPSCDSLSKNATVDGARHGREPRWAPSASRRPRSASATFAPSDGSLVGAGAGGRDRVRMRRGLVRRHVDSVQVSRCQY